MRRFLLLLVAPLLAITLSSCATQPSEVADHTVYFNFGSPALTSEAKARLDVLANRLKSDGDIAYVSIVGYADRIGAPASNEALSKKRAMNVKRYLERNGYRAIQVENTRWVGETQSTGCGETAKRDTVACLQPDRKVEVVFYYTYDYCRHNHGRHCSQRTGW